MVAGAETRQSSVAILLADVVTRLGSQGKGLVSVMSLGYEAR